jgi:hypothetical protein
MGRPRGQPKFGGRRKGTPNKVTAAIRDLAAPYSAEAIAVFVSVMRRGETDATRMLAAREILDRAHGKSRQSVEVAGALPVSDIYRGTDPVEAAAAYLRMIQGED